MTSKLKPISKQMPLYIKQRKIGEGTFGEVHKVLEPKENKLFALKVSRDDFYGREECRYLNMFQNHPNIIKLERFFQSVGDINLVLELCDSDLDGYINSSKEYNPFEVNDILFQILNGLSFVHSKGVIHRDLKPGNILKKGNSIKLADFGLSCEKDISKPLTSTVCSICYRPLEVFEKKVYSFPIDLWSVGCIFAELVNKKILIQINDECMNDSTFKKLIIQYNECVDEQRKEGLSDKINECKENTAVKKIKQLFKMGNPDCESLKVIPAENFDKLSAAGIDLIQKLMQIDPEERIKASDALEHPYFSNKKEKIGKIKK